jgi:hypothetical protein
MAEENENVDAAEAAAEATEPKKPTGQKIMCFVSKQMVPLEETIEIEYAPRKKVRVLPKYIKYGDGDTATA